MVEVLTGGVGWKLDWSCDAILLGCLLYKSQYMCIAIDKILFVAGQNGGPLVRSNGRRNWSGGQICGSKDRISRTIYTTHTPFQSFARVLQTRELHR